MSDEKLRDREAFDHLLKELTILQHQMVLSGFSAFAFVITKAAQELVKTRTAFLAAAVELQKANMMIALYEDQLPEESGG